MVFGRQRPPIFIYKLDPMKRYIVKLVSQKDGSSILPLPDEIVKKFGVEIGDTVELISRKEGGFI